MRSRRPGRGRNAPRGHGALWTDLGWPVLTGGLTALGVFGQVRVGGWAAVALEFVCLALFLAFVIGNTFAGAGMGHLRALRLGAAASLALVALIGLCLLFPLGSWGLAALVTATSPPVTGWLGRRRHGRPELSTGSASSPGWDRAAVDREFHELMATLDQDRFEGPEQS